jgi:hypothetical protein
VGAEDIAEGERETVPREGRRTGRRARNQAGTALPQRAIPAPTRAGGPPRRCRPSRMRAPPPSVGAWPSGSRRTTAFVSPSWAISASAAWMRQRSWCSPRRGVGRWASVPRASRRPPRATRIPTPGERLRCLRAQHGTGSCDVSHRERLGRRPRPERGVLVFKRWSCLRGGEDDSEAFALQNGIFRSLHLCTTALLPVVRQDAERPGRLQRRARLRGLLTDDACDTAGVF